MTVNPAFSLVLWDRWGSRIQLRPASMGDAGQLLEWQQSPGMRRYFRDPQPPTEAAHLAWMSSRLQKPEGLFAIIETGGGVPTGMLRLDPDNDDFEVSILVAPHAQGRGIGRAALALADHAFPGHTLRAFVVNENEQSRRMFVASGYGDNGDGWLIRHPVAIALFRPDGGPGVGLGHFTRSLAVAEALAARNVAVRVALPAGSNLIGMVYDRGAIPLECGLDELALCRLSDLSGAALVVVDHYRLDAERLQPLRLAGARLAVFDDEGRLPLPVDVVINGSPAAAALPYGDLTDPDARRLLGPQWQAIRADLVPLARQAGAMPLRVLVLSGGDDSAGQTALLIAWAAGLCRRRSDLHIDVVAGPFAAAPMRAEDMPAGLNLLRAPPDLPARIAAADVAVSAAGQTLLELACCGIPTIAFCLADNQAPNLFAMDRAGAVLAVGRVGSAGWLERVDQAMERMLADAGLRTRLGRAAGALIDGRGADRVAMALVDVVTNTR